MRERGIQPPPPALRDAHYARRRARGHGEGYVSPHDDPAGRRSTITSRTRCEAARYYVPSGNGEEERAMAIGTGDRAPEFDLEEAFDRPRVRLSDFRGKRNVLLVFHPFAFTPVCAEEALDLQANLESFHNAETEVVFVSCDTSAATAGLEAGARAPSTRSPRTSGSTAPRRSAYGVFDEETGAPIRGHVPDRQGRDRDLVARQGRDRRTEMVPESLEALDEHA